MLCIFQYSCSESFESFLNVSFFIFHVNDMFEGCSDLNLGGINPGRFEEAGTWICHQMLAKSSKHILPNGSFSFLVLHHSRIRKKSPNKQIQDYKAV